LRSSISRLNVDVRPADLTTVKKCLWVAEDGYYGNLTMPTIMGSILDEIGVLKLDDSLLFLNHILAVSRGDEENPALEPLLHARKSGAPAFVIHFLAKQLLLHGSNLGLYELDGPRFLRLMDPYFKLDDPIVHDPN
jgi:hypothetical protein